MSHQQYPYRLCKLLHELDRPTVGERFLAGDPTLYQEYGLKEEEVAALRTKQADALWRLGVHPLLLMQWALFLHRDVRTLFG
jgi:hypothetical protein